MTWRKKLIVFILAWQASQMLACTPIISNVVSTAEWWDTKLGKGVPTTRPWHFESDVIDGKVYPRVVYDCPCGPECACDGCPRE